MEEHKDKVKDFVYLDGFKYEDDFLLLIIPCCECNLANFARESQKKFLEKYKNKKDINANEVFRRNHHFKKEEICYIVEFILKAMAALEDIGVIYSD